MRRTRTMAMVGMAAAALIAAPATAQLSGEHLAAPADAALRLAYAGTRGSAIQEYVPAGETVENWTRMVTVRRFGYRPGVTPMRFAEAWLAGLARACGVATPVPVATTLDGHAGAQARFDCPRNPQTGKPETVLARIVLGDEAFHSVQAASRRAPNAADLAWAERVLAGTQLCLASSAAARCRVTQQPALGSGL